MNHPGLINLHTHKYCRALACSFEPLAKLVSGDRLPHFGPFPGWNFAPWNHHASHSIPKMDSKWDCHSSTQSFARGSFVRK